MTRVSGAGGGGAGQRHTGRDTGRRKMSVHRATEDRRIEVRNFFADRYADELMTDVRRGLTARQKYLPSKYFYDERGSRLFEDICRLPGYYPTRTEMSILRASAAEIMTPLGGCDIVELGAGADWKVRILIDAATCPSGPEGVAAKGGWTGGAARAGCNGRAVRYVPFDVSEAALSEAAQGLTESYPALRVVCVVADFTVGLEEVMASLEAPGPKLFLFLGSTIGNLTEEESKEFLSGIAGAMTGSDRLLLGLDMVKPKGILEAAYNDSEGITEEFNKNILRVVNRELGADFDAGDFDHHAFFSEKDEQVEMHLVSRRDINVEIPALDLTVSVLAGETIHTEICRKFTRASATAIFEHAGLLADRWFTDPKEWFSVVELKTRP
jgi:L-histidine N-alpha-methyltransferase